MIRVMQTIIRGISGKGIFAIALAALLSAVSLGSAYAIENKSECDAAVDKTNKALLKANVSNDKVTEIFSLIDAAIAACASEAFDEAQAKLDAAMADIRASSAQ